MSYQQNQNSLSQENLKIKSKTPNLMKTESELKPMPSNRNLRHQMEKEKSYRFD